MFQKFFFVVLSVVIFQTPMAKACVPAMPQQREDIQVENFTLGLCWLRADLRALTTKQEITDDDEDNFIRLLTEIVGYIPSTKQRHAFAETLLRYVNSHSAPVLKRASLEALGNLHLITPQVRHFLMRSLHDQDEDIRDTAIRSAAAIDPKDHRLQAELLKIYKTAPLEMHRDSALKGLSILTKRALVAVQKAASDDSNQLLQLDAQETLDRWQKTRSAPRAEYTMGVIGDSISAGLYADTNLVDAPKYDVTPQDLHMFWFGSQSSLKEGLARSWASGEKVESHLLKLRKYLAAEGKTGGVEAISVARSGDTTKNLLAQLTALYGKKRLNPSQKMIYLTLLIGNNDICDDKGPEVISKALRRTLVRLNRIPNSGKIVVLLSSLPPIDQLGLPPVGDFPAEAGLNCRNMQKVSLRYCPSYFAADTPEAWAKNKATLDETNRQIGEVVKWAQPLTNLHVVFGGMVGKATLQPAYMAFDCFHPNPYGQRVLSEVLWKELMDAGVKF